MNKRRARVGNGADKTSVASLEAPEVFLTGWAFSYML
jgi:hypothetical protein